MPINILSLKSSLEALKTLRDSHYFGGGDAETDITVSKDCPLTRGSSLKSMLAVISSTWKDDLEKFFISHVEDSYTTRDIPTYKVQQSLEIAVKWICDFNDLVSLNGLDHLNNFEYKGLTTLKELQVFW